VGERKRKEGRANGLVVTWVMRPCCILVVRRPLCCPPPPSRAETETKKSQPRKKQFDQPHLDQESTSRSLSTQNTTRFLYLRVERLKRPSDESLSLLVHVLIPVRTAALATPAGAMAAVSAAAAVGAPPPRSPSLCTHHTRSPQPSYPPSQICVHPRWQLP